VTAWLGLAPPGAFSDLELVFSAHGPGIAFLGSLFFAPLIKHPCPILFQQSINPSTLHLALYCDSVFPTTITTGPAILGFTHLA
jgi:hypothetical protein